MCVRKRHRGRERESQNNKYGFYFDSFDNNATEIELMAFHL